VIVISSLLTLAAPPLDIITVEGTRLPLTAAESGTAVTIITKDDLEAIGAVYVIDAIAAVPGVTANQTGSFGGIGSIRLRGTGTDQSVVLLNGVPVGDTSSVGGVFDFARLDATQIERIEVLRGPQSTFWGSEAIGGVIAITTKKAEGGVDAFAEAGSFGSVRGGAALSGRSNRGGWRLGASALTADGISKADRSAGNTETDGHRSQSISAAWDYKLGNAIFDGAIYGSSAETAIDTFDFTAPGAIADGNSRMETDEWTANNRVRIETGGVDHQFIVGGSLIERANFDNGAASFSANGQRGTLRYQGTITTENTTSVSFGLEKDVRRADGRDASIDSAFLLGSVAIIKGLRATGGLRIDDHSQFGSETTGRAAIAWQAFEGLQFRASYGEGFRAPSLFQQTFFCCSAVAPNQSLAAERSEGFDAGVVLSTPRASLEVGYFQQDTENLIDFSFATGGYINIAEAETKGVEASASLDILTWLSAQMAYTLTEAEDGQGQSLARIPRHKGDLALTVDPVGPWTSSIMLRYNGEEEDNFGVVDAWTRVDVSAQYTLSSSLKVYMRAENLLNESYQQVFGYGTPGRSANVGLRASF